MQGFGPPPSFSQESDIPVEISEGTRRRPVGDGECSRPSPRPRFSTAFTSRSECPHGRAASTPTPPHGSEYDGGHQALSTSHLMATGRYPCSNSTSIPPRPIACDGAVLLLSRLRVAFNRGYRKYDCRNLDWDYRERPLAALIVAEPTNSPLGCLFNGSVGHANNARQRRAS